jgi:pimeloyl-ACP methyl ester carboxylesterase
MLEQQLSYITVPTLIMYGKLDQVIDPAESVKLHQGISHSKIYEFQRAGHFPNMTNAAEFNAALDDFLSSVDFLDQAS